MLMATHLIRWASLIAAMLLSFNAEYHLALACGFKEYTAAAFPIALDLFMVYAIRQGTDVAASVAAVVAFNVAANLLGGHAINALTAVSVAASSAPPLIVWRMHHRKKAPVSAPEAALERSVNADTQKEIAPPTQPPTAAPKPTKPTASVAVLASDADLIKKATALGEKPSLRRLQSEFGIGQRRAMRIQAALVAAA
jgi:hypothetical protein